MVTNSDLSNGLHCLVFKHMVSEVSGLLAQVHFLLKVLTPHLLLLGCMYIVWVCSKLNNMYRMNYADFFFFFFFQYSKMFHWHSYYIV